MSFTSDIKTELCKLEPKKLCCLRAECYGAWLFSRCFSLSPSSYVTENPAVARRMLELAAAGAGISGEMDYGVSRRKKAAYKVFIPGADGREALLDAFGHSGRETSLRINRGALENECCTAAFLRGAFLTCGSVADPSREYALEFSVPHKNLANSLYTLLSDVSAFELTPSVGARRSGYAVYVKDGGQIEDLLTYMGAASASMELMQVRMYKSQLMDINRRANFETANMDKTYSASARQIAAIAALSDAGELNRLPDGLRELAVLRLENPDMSLRELSERMGISRSGVNHRLQRLLELGERFLGSQTE